MPKNNLNWGCGASLDITGCRFFIAPMCNDYVERILGAVERVNTKKIWSATDATSTVYRGKRIHVVDCVKACFVQAYHKDIHMVMEATFSKGCPGDSDADCFVSEDDVLLNACEQSFNVLAKIAFYPLGIPNYMEHIAKVVNIAVDMGVYVKSSHYVTILEGDVNDVFTYIEKLLAYADENISHHVLELTLSVNSPTKEVR